jgi:enoyl-CoA hydratase/carnithine racemase
MSALNGAPADELALEEDGPILRITLNRPHDRNRVSSATAIAIANAIHDIPPATRLIVFASRGEDFCAGWLGPPEAAAPAGTMEAYEGRRLFDAVFNCYAAIRDARVPVVCAVQGAARGFGCAIAAICDITIAVDTAVFQIPEMAHNILPTMVAWALRDRVAPKIAGYLAYSADEFDAAYAHAIGLINKVVPAAQLDESLASICATLLGRPQAALEGLKEFLRASGNMDAHGSLEYARSLHATVNTSRVMAKPH